jgi:hypothetical protein
MHSSLVLLFEKIYMRTQRYYSLGATRVGENVTCSLTEELKVLDAAVQGPRGPSCRGRGPEVPSALVPPYHDYQVGGEVVAARLDGLHVVDPDGPVPSGVETHVRVFLFQPGSKHATDLFYYRARTTPLLGRGIEPIHVLHKGRFFGKSLQSRGFFRNFHREFIVVCSHAAAGKEM